MMGMAKMSPDDWAYYAKEVAAGAEDYYVGHGEEPGCWIGRGAETLGLSGEADSEGLSRLFGHGCDPGTGTGLGRPFDPDSTAVAGYALSFAPPKSVSVLWALAPAEITAAVRDGHDEAVAAAMDFLQDHAAFCRRGHGGAIQEATGGSLAAAFVHRTSRAGDPQLHSHVLVANKVQAVSDGRWLSIDGRELYEVQKAAGMLYKGCLRAELTARLGVGWTGVDDNGGAEIVGVPDQLIGLFSKRRAQVETAAAGLLGERQAVLGRSLTGDEKAALFQLAAYRSRAAKGDGGETTDQLRARWRAEATAAGHPSERWLSRPAGRQLFSDRETLLARAGLRTSVELVLAETIEVLERKHSTWGRAEVIEALTIVLPTGNAKNAAGFRRAVEAAADMVLAHSDVVTLTCPDRLDTRHGGLRYSTWWTFQTEQAILDVVEAGRTAGSAVAPTYRVLADAGLGDDQAEAVRRLCGDGERVAVLVGPAGSGKSRSLSAARQAWETAGIPVRGVAPSAVAAGVLTEQAGIPSETLAKLLLDASKGRLSLQPGSVVVCDEASMVATRDLARLVLLVEAAGAKLVLVGDHYQLGSVEAGGLFRLLATDATTAELTGIRRFTDPWEAQASRRLRLGDPAVIDEYLEAGRVRSGDRDHTLDVAHHAWLDGRRQGRTVVVMAADHDTVDQLALRARAARVASGEVEADGITVGNQTVGVGDEIVTTHNDRHLVTTVGAWVRNGDRWQIRHRHPNGAVLAASVDGPGTVTLPGDYVANNVALAYAVTVHKGQGLTVDEAVLVVDRATAAEHLYVGMTRGRHHNLACVTTEPAGDEHQHHEPPTAADVLVAALRKTSSQKSATETLRDELDHPSITAPGIDALVDGLRQCQAHTGILGQASRRETTRQALTQARSEPAPEPAIYQGIDL
jgi:conjugative relaxase-like TrwC/TraI family protein